MYRGSRWRWMSEEYQGETLGSASGIQHFLGLAERLRLGPGHRMTVWDRCRDGGAGCCLGDGMYRGSRLRWMSEEFRGETLGSASGNQHFLEVEERLRLGLGLQLTPRILATLKLSSWWLPCVESLFQSCPA